ncbi:MAG: tyrosine-type recombinase/integrase [Anaerolineales bacterium]|jgi:integrase/recombinase XerD
MEHQVRAFLADMQTQSTYSPNTCQAYHNDLRCFINFLEHTLNRPPLLKDFTAPQVAEFLNSESRNGRRPSTLLRRRASIRSFAKFLSSTHAEWAADFEAESDRIDEAITDEAVSAPSTAQKQRYLTEDQIQRLFKIMESSQSPRARRDQAILTLLLESGITVGSLTTLDLCDVDILDGRINLPVQDGKDYWVSLNRAREPVLRYLEESRQDLNYHPEEPALFISQTGRRMSRQGVWQVLRQWGSRAALPLTLSPRLARHTAVYHMALEGKSPEHIQMLLGHSNPLSTYALLRRLGVLEQLNTG